MFGAGYSVLRGLIPLNRSPNSAIFSVSSAYWPDVVLKRNSLQQAVTEDQMQHAIRHIRVLPVVGVVMIMTTELDKGQPAPHLALTREDPSLEQHVRHNRWVWQLAVGPQLYLLVCMYSKQLHYAV